MSRQGASSNLPTKAAPQVHDDARPLSIRSLATTPVPDPLQSWWRAVEHVSYLLQDDARGYWQLDAEQRYQVPVTNEDICALLRPDRWAHQLVKMIPARYLDEDTIASILSSLWSLDSARRVYRRDDSEGHLITIDTNLKRLSELVDKAQPKGLRRLVREWLSRYTQADPVLRMVQEFRKVWREASDRLDEEMGSFSENVLSVAHNVCDSLGTTFSSEVEYQATYGRLSIVVIDTSSVFDDRPSKVPVIFLHGERLLNDDLDDIRHVLSHEQEHIAFLVMFTRGDPVEDSRRLLGKFRQTYAYDVCVFDHRRMLAMIGAREPQRSLRKIVFSEIDLDSVSPFTTAGPTRDDMFFGREKELREISDHVDSVSYAIIGGRRVGKTSILFRLHRILLPKKGFYTLYHDCSTTSTHDAFLREPIRYWQPNPPPHAPTTLGDLLRSLPVDRHLVLLLDETGALISTDWDKGWPLFKTLRALADSGHTQVVLAGESTLLEALQDSSTPLFNFPNKMVIGCLNFASVEELVVEPMKRLEIRLVNEKEVVSRIYDFTSGHPNVVQRLCQRLVRRLNEQGIRHITPDDVNEVVKDPRFQHEDFLDTYWGMATTLEKIISLLMVSARETCALKALRQILADQYNLHPQARAVKGALQRLVDLRSILRYAPTGYEFLVDAFPRVVADTVTLNEMLDTLTEEYAEEQTREESNLLS
jgi:hypothetical protein